MAESSVTASFRSLIASLLKQLRDFRNAKAHIQLLNKQLMNLQAKKEEIMINVDIANNNAQVIAQGVDGWLEEAKRVTEEAELFLSGSINSQMSCYSSSKCSSLKLRYSIGKKVEVMVSNISKLLEAVHIFHAPPPPRVNNLESRMSIETEIITALLDESISMIGVCGMVGVGKTTAVKTIVNDVREKKIFDEVVLAVVTQNPNIMGIQAQLYPSLAEGTVVARAETLHKKLMHKSSRILVILDDIWKELDLSTIGIRGDWPKGLKVILTSRQLNVCRKMEVQKIVQVEPLSEKEALSLFEQVAEISQDAPEGIKEIASRMANKCYGLPLLIECVGKKEEDEWRNHLQEFSRDQDKFGGRLPSVVMQLIQLSYNYLLLESKAVLLICSLFPEDYEIWIEDLARYAKGLQVFKSINYLLQTREKLESIINMLIDCFLLLKCGNDRVKLHGVVRIYCLSIATARKDMPTTSHEELMYRIPKDANEYCTAISLCIAEPAQLFSLQSTELQLLRLIFHEQGSSISTRDFLQGMEKLEVLDIQSVGLELIPLSLQSLMSLRTLSLHYCRLEKDLSAIASLQSIEILSFYGSTYVGKFPNEIGELKHLKSLDLRFFKGFLDPIPSGILLNFSRLEELYLGSVIPEKIIAEIGSLLHLNTIQVLLDSNDGLVKLLEGLDVDNLIRFYICVGPSEDVPYHFVRRLVVEEVDVDILLQKKMNALVRRCVEELKLRRIKGLNNLVRDFANKSNGFQELKELKLIECHMKYLGNSNDSTTPESGAFVELEKLYIRRATKLEGLYLGNFPPKSFCKLQEVIMSGVPLLSYLWNDKQSPNLSNLVKLQLEGGKVIRSLFSPSCVKHLHQLQIIKIIDCPKLETMIYSDDQEGRDTLEDIAQFPKLEELYLDGVRSFHRFYSDMKGDEPRKRILSCTLPKLRCMRISGSERLQILFDFEGLVRNVRADTDQLNSLHLSDLPKLRRLWGILPKGTLAFQNLETIVVEKCRGLKYLLTPSMANILVSLRSLQVICCDQMEAIIGKAETNNVDDIQATPSEILELEEEEEEENHILQLNYLSHIELFDLPMLRMLCSQSINLSFPSLDEFGVAFCPIMNKFCEGELSAPELKVVDCLPYGTVSFHTMSNYLKECEDKNKCLNCAIRRIDMCNHLDGEASRGTTILFIKARDLIIAWIDNSMYWEWLPISETNKTEIASLISVWWFDIRAIVNTKLLIKNTDYTAYLVYHLQDNAKGLDSATATVRYIPQMANDDSRFTVFLTKKKTLGSNKPFATTRADGRYLEIALGRFHTRDSGTNDRVVEIRLLSTDTLKSGIHVLGIEVRSD